MDYISLVYALLMLMLQNYVLKTYLLLNISLMFVSAEWGGGMCT